MFLDMEPGLRMGDTSKILIVDDEVLICSSLARFMRSEGFDVLVANDGEGALRMIGQSRPDAVFLDLKMPGMSGMEVLKKAKELDPDIPVVILTAYADVPGAVDAMKAGAHDYLAKPFDHVEVSRVVRRAVSECRLKKKLKELSRLVEDNHSLVKLMGPSDLIRCLVAQVNRVAQSEFNVIITGETGSGKELVARAIHFTSARSRKPFVAVDCGAIPETLLESELFGHEKGAFTGAVALKQGKFEAAAGGTLLLDEIGNMPLSSQAKLLRVLQEKKMFRVGGLRSIDVDVRLLVASNKALEESVKSGSFREDLYYRLNEFTIRIPALRDRKEDIPYLAGRFLDATNLELDKSVGAVSEEAMAALMSHEWPGNVRELRSTIRRAVLLAGDEIRKEHVDMPEMTKLTPQHESDMDGTQWKGVPLKEIVKRNVEAVEREVLMKVLQYTGGNKAKAARMLEIDYKTIHTKVRQFGLLKGGNNE
jgi:DNA-binding NtrC family response regulator